MNPYADHMHALRELYGDETDQRGERVVDQARAETQPRGTGGAGSHGCDLAAQQGRGGSNPAYSEQLRRRNERATEKAARGMAKDQAAIIAAIASGNNTTEDLIAALGLRRKPSGKQPNRLECALRHLREAGRVFPVGQGRYVVGRFLESGLAASGAGLGAAVDSWLYGA